MEGPFLNYTLRVPLGVVGQITPWNHPLLIATKKIAPALAAGNTIVLKPSELAPLSVLEFGRICQEAGLPEGVLNIVPGFGPTAGRALCEHPDVAKIDVTGSTATGQAISRLAAGTMKRVSCELGGKAPNIVFARCRPGGGGERGALRRRSSARARPASREDGSSCMRPSMMPSSSVFWTKASRIRVGDPLLARNPDGSADLPIPARKDPSVRPDRESPRGRDSFWAATIPEDPAFPRGFFYTPTIFDDVRNPMRIAQEEIFGPVVAVIRFDDEAEAIREANAIPFGLGAAVWTRDVGGPTGWRRRIRAGVIWLNDYHRIDPASPWGGFKMSGIGRENGLEAIRHCTEVKSIWVSLDDCPIQWYEGGGERQRLN